MPQPPTSTPFPYTTLFRSNGSFHNRVTNKEHRHQPDKRPRRDSSHTHSSAMTPERIRNNPSVALVSPPLLDRKSTRLNSSHEWISYAVFCLKKKKCTIKK